MALDELFRISQVNVWGYARKEVPRFCRSIKPKLAHISFKPCDSLESCVRDMDIVVTVTPSRRPLIRRSWISAGTHINAVGADAPGKQELDPDLLRQAQLFCDLPAQSVQIGEFQHVSTEIGAGKLTLTALGHVLNGEAPGRLASEAITVFDSSGISLQDLYIASRILQACEAVER